MTSTTGEAVVAVSRRIKAPAEDVFRILADPDADGDVRHILLHVLAEVACHSGRSDAVRELIDGTTWLGGSSYAG
ncbi:DinB family protein [Streptomyces sp. NBC_01604]|uniref:mycothiol transferase n=1 Tax=Streptomyces sp. NBC_01604 TaxID=2975894 RepID=UPI00386DA80E